jgi:hypothetical protein
MRILRSSRIFAFLLLCFCVSNLRAQSTIGDRQVTASKAGTPTTAPLSTTAVTVASPQEVDSKLRENGIKPDSDAKSLVYSMNPSVNSLQDINSSFALAIPVAQDSNDQVKLTVDHSLKESIKVNTDSIVSSTTNSQAKVFKDRNALNLTKQSAQDLTIIATQFEKVPSSRDFLVQTDLDSSTLKTLVKQDSLSADDKLLLQNLREDLTAKKDWFSTDRTDPVVHVRTVSSLDGKPVALLTVCYVQALMAATSCDNTFDEPTKGDSSTDRRLPVANYFIWAQDTGGHRKTEQKRLEVRTELNVVLLTTP